MVDATELKRLSSLATYPDRPVLPLKCGRFFMSANGKLRF